MSEEIKDIRNEYSEQIIDDTPVLPTPEEIAAEKKAMKRVFSRCGWATLLLVGSALVMSIILGVVMGIFGNYIEMIQSNLLYINEVMVGLACLIGALLIVKLPKSAPKTNSIGVKAFFALLSVSIAVSTVGNIIGTRWLLLLELFTGASTENQITSVLTDMDAWQLIICAGILAPIIEELFFRKLIIDRMIKYGEVAAILSSAVLFGLFHQNLAQFFYTFGVGLIWGYVYCKTGSYKVVVLLHMAFNFIGGVLPSVILTDTTGLAELLNSTTEFSELIPILFAEYGLLILAYIIYIFGSLALNIGGIAVVLMNVKKIKLERGDSILTAQEKKHAAMRNSGMIAAAIGLMILSIIAVF